MKIDYKEFFSKGHLDCTIVGYESDETDIDCVVPDYHASESAAGEAECMDSNGSEYKLLEYHEESRECIVNFTCYDREYELANGDTLSWEKKSFLLRGEVLVTDYVDEHDFTGVLNITGVRALN